ncbi:MAG: PaREP1 family protein [Nitrososphaerales archaeon]
MTSKSKVEHYRCKNGKYLREAEEYLAKKDYPQASEKFWSPAVEIIKASVAKRGITFGDS